MYADETPPSNARPDMPRKVKDVNMPPACRKNVVSEDMLLFPIDQPELVLKDCLRPMKPKKAINISPMTTAITIAFIYFTPFFDGVVFAVSLKISSTSSSNSGSFLNRKARIRVVRTAQSMTHTHTFGSPRIRPPLLTNGKRGVKISANTGASTRRYDFVKCVLLVLDIFSPP